MEKALQNCSNSKKNFFYLGNPSSKISKKVTQVLWGVVETPVNWWCFISASFSATPVNLVSSIQKESWKENTKKHFINSLKNFFPRNYKPKKSEKIHKHTSNYSENTYEFSIFIFLQFGQNKFLHLHQKPFFSPKDV